jgi:hypothetical protein
MLLKININHYPFGSVNQNRSFSASSYRYGFGGHEKEDEVNGNGNHLSFADYGYDPRLARRWDIDPLSSQYPWQSPYVVFNNNPIYFSDPTGLKGEPPEDQQVIKTAGGGYMNIPASASVETFGAGTFKTTGGTNIAADAKAAKAFTADGIRYVAGFNSGGDFTGYVAASDMKSVYSPADILYQDKVASTFKDKLLEISFNLKQDPNKLMAVFAQETGETFSASTKSADGQVGLIQFTGTAITQINSTFGTSYTKAGLEVMTAEAQLDVVQQYFQTVHKSIVTINDYALATFSPKNTGKSNGTVIYSKGEDRYKKNKGLDTNKDGKITVGEVGAKYAKKYVTQ